jgi:hypothetical protein
MLKLICIIPRMISIIMSNRTVYKNLKLSTGHSIMTMSSSYAPSPIIIDPFVLHFLQSSIQPPPPLPTCIFLYDPFLIVPPIPTSSRPQLTVLKSTMSTSSTTTTIEVNMITCSRLVYKKHCFGLELYVESVRIQSSSIHAYSTAHSASCIHAISVPFIGTTTDPCKSFEN